MIVARTGDELHAAVGAGSTFVPTMGALHEGHASLIRLGASLGDPVVVSDFVNPTQFGPGEDFERYPRDLEADAVLAEAAGAAVLYAPSVEEVYPAGFATAVDPGPLALELCGRSRPGHFTGVATVVTRLYGLVRPARAIFGRKDYQQLTLLRRVARDLALGVEVLAAPTVREDDGLAMSSRNRYLTSDERRTARAVPALLRDIAVAYGDGARAPEDLLATATPSGIELEYLELRDEDLGPYVPDRVGVALVAVRVGTTRLIDNILLDPAAPTAAADELHAKELA